MKNRFRLRGLIGAVLLLGLVWGCHYPYTARQARDARKSARISKGDGADTARLSPTVAARDTALLGGAAPKAQPDSIANARGRGREKPVTVADSLAVRRDSLAQAPMALDTPITDTARFNGVRTVRLSKDSVDSPVSYEARDSMWYDLVEEKIYLWGNASLLYGELSIKADKITVDFRNNLATAEGRYDSLARKRVGDPEFKDGENGFTARRIEYNFETKKGKVYEAVTAEGDGFLRSADAKFIGKENGQFENDVVFSKNCLYTTCNAPEPHFGVRATKAKVVPGKLIVVGPSYVEIAGIPTPLALPFGFFPITQNRRSGLIIPQDLETNPQLGIGFKNFGYYFGINDRIDLALTGDIYTRGSFALNANSNYKVRYRFGGSLRASYLFRQFDEPETPDFQRQQEFNISWNHRQEAGARPNSTFSATLNFGTASFFRNVSNDANNVLRSNLNSNISYTKTWPGTPFNLAISMQHSQEVATRSISISFPVVDFRINRIYPFRRKKQVGKPRWYEEIGFSYSTSVRNQLVDKDTTLFSPRWSEGLLDKLRFGINHDPQLQLSLKVFKYINVNPSINYNERWYFYRDRRTFDPTLQLRSDTTFAIDGSIAQIANDTTFGSLSTAREYGFFPVRDFSAGISVSTQLFGSLKFRRGPLRAVRHVLRPNLSFNWRPDFGQPRWGYVDSTLTDTRYPDRYDYYNFYEGAAYLFGTAGTGQSALLNFSLNNSLEAKVFAPRDSSAKDGLKKIKLLNNFSVTGSYNFIADSLRLSPINFSANTTFLKIVNANFRMTLDPYVSDTLTNKRLDRFLVAEQGTLARLTSATLTLSTGFDGSTIRDLFRGKKADKKPNGKPERENPFQLIQRTQLNYNLNLSRRFENGRDTLSIVQNLGVIGALNLSRHWKLDYQFNYDFVQKRIAYPQFRFYRDLHCWELGLDWQPERRTWTFFLRVKSGSLNFLNIPARKNFFDPF